MGSVYTKKGFCVANAKLPHYNISNNITGETQHITLYVSMTKSSYSLLAKNCIKSLG
jgi:hypothetical protein